MPIYGMIEEEMEQKLDDLAEEELANEEIAELMAEREKDGGGDEDDADYSEASL